MCAPSVASIRYSKIYYVFFGFLAKQQQRQPNKSIFANERKDRDGKKKRPEDEEPKKKKRNSIWLWNFLRLTVNDVRPLLVADVARMDRVGVVVLSILKILFDFQSALQHPVTV